MLKILSQWMIAALLLGGCSTVYYGAMEKVGIHKRDIMVTRVEDVKESQEDAQKEFKSALERFGSVVDITNTNLKAAYDDFSDQYDDAKDAADDLSSRIDKLEDVSLALFDEWEEELEQYQNQKLKSQSSKKLRDTRAKYNRMMKSMRKSEASMQPVLRTFHDNVLTLKHSLNAQAIGALQGEFKNLKGDVATLIKEMNKSIKESDTFIAELQ